MGGDRSVDKVLLCRNQDLCLDVYHLHKRQTLQSLSVASTLEGGGKRWVCYSVSSLGSSESTGFDEMSCLKNNAKERRVNNIPIQL